MAIIEGPGASDIVVHRLELRIGEGLEWWALLALMYVVVVMDRDWLVLIEKVDPSGVAIALELVLLQ